jgi:cystathionine beta-lyase family protein involved in aluminum resistance
MNSDIKFCRSSIWSLAQDAEADIQKILLAVRQRAELNHYKVLSAFREMEVSDYHFNETTGYGYGDIGRDLLDQLYARVFGAEAGLVRPQIVSGTHAIALCFYGVLRPGDEVLFATGQPYDTLSQVMGTKQNGDGSLADWGITSRVIPLNNEDKPDFSAIVKAITPATKMVAIQRSRGYSLRPSFSISDIEQLIGVVKQVKPGVTCFVDNCYGEFVENKEPSQVGADLVAGSLIKNPGGGIAPAGGYIVGKADLIQKIANRLTAPGLGTELGCSLAGKRLYFQGLFLAPLVVAEALQGTVLTARLMSALGFKVTPHWEEERTDIIQAIIFGSRERLVAFCQGLQKGSPVDSYITPEASPMPGYEDRVIMAGGTFIQGSSIELSADGPLREPYVAYLQGGLAYPYIKAGLLTALEHMAEQGLISV